MKEFFVFSVPQDGPLLNALSHNQEYQQNSENSKKLPPFPATYSTIPWFEHVTEPHRTKKDFDNFTSSMTDLGNISATKNGPCVEKKSTISFSVESIIGTKWYGVLLHFIVVYRTRNRGSSIFSIKYIHLSMDWFLLTVQRLYNVASE